MGISQQFWKPTQALPFLVPAVEEPRWYAVHTRARHEKSATAQLQRIGVTTFLPLIRQTHRWSDRQKTIQCVLFDCYTFVRLESYSEKYLPILKTPGVIGFVGMRGGLRGRKTLYEVLSMAGGPNETAGSSLTVTRRRENGEIPLPGATVDSTGQFSTAELNVQEILEGKNPAVNIEIKPHDTISVSEANANMIYVVGDVEHGGAFTLGGRQSLSVLRSLSLAGGLGRTAKPQKARIIRSVPGELKPQEIAVNIKQIFNGKAEDIMLLPQDVLVVPTSSRKVFTTYSVPSIVSAAAYAAIYR